MQSYTKKTEEHLAWEDARDLIRAEIRRVTRRVTNEAYAELDALCARALNEGEAIEVTPTRSEIKALVYSTLKELDPGA